MRTRRLIGIGVLLVAAAAVLSGILLPGSRIKPNSRTIQEMNLMKGLLLEVMQSEDFRPEGAEGRLATLRDCEEEGVFDLDQIETIRERNGVFHGISFPKGEEPSAVLEWEIDTSEGPRTIVGMSDYSVEVHPVAVVP